MTPPVNLAIRAPGWTLRATMAICVPSPACFSRIPGGSDANPCGPVQRKHTLGGVLKDRFTATASPSVH